MAQPMHPSHTSSSHAVAAALRGGLEGSPAHLVRFGPAMRSSERIGRTGAKRPSGRQTQRAGTRRPVMIRHQL